MLDGVTDGGAWICGAVTGPIRDSPTVKALIDRIMAEADALIARRLGRLAVVVRERASPLFHSGFPRSASRRGVSRTRHAARPS